MVTSSWYLRLATAWYFSNYSGVASQFDLLNCLKCLENDGKPLTAILASILSTILSGPFSCKVIYLHIYIYTYILNINILIYIYICRKREREKKCVCVCVCIHMHYVICVCIYIYTLFFMSVCGMYVCVYTLLCIYTYVCVISSTSSFSVWLQRDHFHVCFESLQAAMRDRT